MSLNVPRGTPGFEPYTRRLTFTEAVKLLVEALRHWRKNPPPKVGTPQDINEAIEREMYRTKRNR